MKVGLFLFLLTIVGARTGNACDDQAVKSVSCRGELMGNESYMGDFIFSRLKAIN